MIELTPIDCTKLALLAEMDDWYAQEIAKGLSLPAQEIARAMRGCTDVSEEARETGHGILKWAQENKR
jgi:hypothetical protein